MFSRLPKTQIIALIALTILHVVVSWHTIVPGYLLIDEAFYHWMTRDFASTGSLELWNGYTEFPSPELTHRHVPVHKNRLVAQWPHFFAIIATPLYLMWGLLGLYVVNVIAFIGVVWLCFLSANKLFEDPKLALNACLLLVLATFAWEYSQAIWPHSTALFFIMAAFYFTVCALNAQKRSNRLWLAFGAGLICGFATGIRMDTFLASTVVVLPFLFARPWRPVSPCGRSAR